MAFNHLLHLCPSPILRPSIALFLIISMFAVPFLALSSELIPGTLLSLALPLWETLFGLLTSPPFYYFLLNLLIVTLVFTSGFFNPSRPKEEKDEEQEGDLHARDHHHYITAAEMIHERLSLHELYGTQASSLPYVSYTEGSDVYVEDPVVIRNVYAEDEVVIRGNQMIMNPSASSLLQQSAFQLSPMEGNDAPALCALEEKAFSSSESIRMDMVKRSAVTDDIIGDGSEEKKPPLICSADMNHEGTPHDECRLCNQFQAEKGKVVDDDDNHDHDHDDNGNDHVDDDYNDHVAHDDEKRRFMRICDSIPSIHHYDMDVDNLCIESSNAEGLSDDCRNPHNSSLELSLDDSRGIELSHNDDVGAMQRLGNGDSCHVDDVRRGKEEILMSAEEFNERASAFITAFRRKLHLSSDDDQLR